MYDKSRQALIKSLKIDGSTWVSKYARGGSARSQSARNMYIAVDAVQGYLASNGWVAVCAAPYLGCACVAPVAAARRLLRSEVSIRVPAPLAYRISSEAACQRLLEDLHVAFCFSFTAHPPTRTRHTWAGGGGGGGRGRHWYVACWLFPATFL